MFLRKYINYYLKKKQMYYLYICICEYIYLYIYSIRYYLYVKVYNLIFEKFYFCKYLISNLFLLINNVYSIRNLIYFVEFYVDGLFYRVKNYKKFKKLGFILGYNSYLLYTLPSYIYVKVSNRRRRFFLFSFKFYELLDISFELLNFKFPNIYHGKGLKFLYYKYKKKMVVKQAYR